MINGKALGWLSCTAYAMAMAIDKASLGTKQPSGCAIRRITGDTVGGTMLRQVGDAAHSLGVHVDVFVGSGVADPEYVWDQFKKGRGAVLQGNASAMLNTRFRSTNGPVNHAVYVNEVKGSGASREALVYDPAADDRKKGIDDGPSWWPWSLVLKFAASLEPFLTATNNDHRKLGPGRMYVGIMPDTEPHVHKAFGGVKTSPFPDRTRALEDGTRVHSAPKSSDATVIGHLEKDELFTAFQVAIGDEYKGSVRWYGDHDGKRWVHAKRLSHTGGTT